MSNRINILKTLSLAVVAIACVNMGGVEQTHVVPEPQFISLEDEQVSYVGTIVDEGKKTQVKNISFSGKTNIGGIRREEDNAVIEVDLGNFKELTVEKKSYDSERYSDREFTLVSGVSKEGAQVKNLLFPPKIVLCAESTQEGSRGMKLSWFLRDIEKIVINHEATIKAREQAATGTK